MKDSIMQTALRWYFRLQIVILCVALVAVSVDVASGRTEYVSKGEAVSVQTDKPVPKRHFSLFQTKTATFLWENREYLPFPVGNVICIVRATKALLADRKAQVQQNA